MLNLKFPVIMATGERLKIAKDNYLAFFSSKLISKCSTINAMRESKRLVVYTLP
jgi:hypothetical protein